MYTQTSRQGQSRQGQSWQRGTAAPFVLRLTEGSYELGLRGNGLWGFEAEGTAYTIKHRHSGSTKPVLYLMAELKPRPAYVSSLYFLSWHSGSVSKGMQSAMAWQYAAQLPAASEPVLYVSMFQVLAVGNDRHTAANNSTFIEVSHSEDSCRSYWLEQGSGDYVSHNSRAFFLPF